MQIQPFELERYFARYEFDVPYLLSASDCESLALPELLAWADDESLALWQGLRLGYTASQGYPPLRQEIARLYPGFSAGDVLVLAPEEGIFVAMNTLLKPGDHAIVTFPGYQSLYEIARARGGTVTPWTLQPGENGWELDLDLLEASITPQTCLLVINFPHNPTGYLPTRAQLEHILDLARRHQLYIFSDEMYWLLEHDPQQRLPALCTLYERAISLFGVSKTFSLPGLRIGWLVTRDRDLLQRFIGFKDYTTICSSAPSEILALIGLRARDRIIARNLALIRQNHETLDQFFAQYPGRFHWLPPQAGSIAFPRWTGGTPVARFCQELLDYGVMALPGEVFQFPGDHFRVGLGRRDLLQTLTQVHQYLSRTEE